jgi:hypothetical protein
MTADRAKREISMMKAIVAVLEERAAKGRLL